MAIGECGRDVATKSRLGVLIAIVLLSATAGVIGHGGATGIVKERMDLMGTIGDAMKALTSMMRGKEPYDIERVRTNARTIAELGGKRLKDLFPKGSLDHPTEALPAIWTDWERFSALSDQLSAYAEALQSAASNERSSTGGDMAAGGNLMSAGSPSPAMVAGVGMTAAGDPTPEQLARLAPDAAFERLTQTCAACHEDFRLKQ